MHDGELALVFNPMSAAGARERRASLYDEIDDDDDAAGPRRRKEPVVNQGRTQRLLGRTARADDGGYFAWMAEKAGRGSVIWMKGMVTA